MFLITGGGSGIGRALAQALAVRAQNVMIVGRREAALAKTAAFSASITYLCADVSREEGRQQIAASLDQIDSLAGLIHNAATIEPLMPMAALSQSAWQESIAINLNAPLFLTQLLLDKLQQGRVLHIGSGAAYFPVSGWAAYCVSKAGLAMLTHCWQLENPELAITSVMPGIIDTPMQELIRSCVSMNEERRKFFIELYEEKRLLSTATVAAFLCWLLLEVEPGLYRSKEWDIYDKSHHRSWLRAPHQVPSLN